MSVEKSRETVRRVLLGMAVVLMVVVISVLFKASQEKSQSSQSTLSMSQLQTNGEVLGAVIDEQGNLNYNFAKDGVLPEAGKMSESWSPYFWLNSGGYLIIENGVGKTVQKKLSENDRWRLLYSKSNPKDTANGAQPQNIFRLVTKQTWLNYSQVIKVKIDSYNTSISSNRNASNGVLLLHRYLDGDNLYYAGVRVDGQVVIKKKYRGKYYTMFVQKIFLDENYQRDDNPNLIPENSWFGLMTQIANLDHSQVQVRVFIDQNNTGSWQLVAEAVDDGQKYGGKAITEPGFAGIRTDFMDAEFDDYQVRAINP